MKFSKSLFALCIFGLLALPLMGVASAQNLLVNGDFETGDLTGWQVFGATVTVDSPDNGPSLPGTHNAFLENFAEAANLTLKQSTAAGSAGPGTVYYAFDAKFVQAEAGGVVHVECFAEQTNVGVIGGTGIITIAVPSGDWLVDEPNYSGTFVAPANTDFLTFQISAVTGAIVGSICRVKVDNAHLAQAGPPVATEDMSMGSIKALFR